MHRPMAAVRGRMAFLVVAMAIACGALVAASVHWSLSRTARAEAARLTRVTATILDPAADDRSRPAVGHWTVPGGGRRTGVVPAPPHKRAGDDHPIWVDEAGRRAEPPKNATQRGVQTLLAGLAVTAAIIMVTGRGLPRPDHVDGEWLRVAPDWKRRYL